jgi:hypothetical protein
MHVIEQDITYPLLRIGEQEWSFSPTKRLVTTPASMIRLSPLLNELLHYTLQPPNSIVYYLDVYNLRHPDMHVPSWDMKNREHVHNQYHPLVNRLREKLKGGHISLKESIVTVQSRGVMFVPHTSVREKLMELART